MNTKNTKAFTLITGIVLLMSVMIMGLVSISIMHWTSADIETYFEQGQELAAVADACTEEGAIRLKRDANFRTVTLNVSGSSCTITLNNPAGDTYSGSIVTQTPGGQKINNGISLRRIVQGQFVQIQITSYTTL